jgi:hypothetical protein
VTSFSFSNNTIPFNSCSANLAEIINFGNNGVWQPQSDHFRVSTIVFLSRLSSSVSFKFIMCFELGSIL